MTATTKPTTIESLHGEVEALLAAQRDSVAELARLAPLLRKVEVDSHQAGIARANSADALESARRRLRDAEASLEQAETRAKLAADRAAVAGKSLSSVRAQVLAAETRRDAAKARLAPWRRLTGGQNGR